MKMTDEELRSWIERQESRAKRPEVAYEQAMAMDYYLRRPFGNEEDGRSQVISSDVWDVVEGMTPIILKPFVSSSDVVQFNPVGPEDEEAAKQETDYLNYVVTQRNDSFIQLTALAKAGLLQKNGIAKYWWDTTRRVSIRTLEGLTDDEYTSIVNDDEVTVLEHTSTQAMLMDMPITLHDVKIRRVEKEGCAKYKVVPPEQFRIVGDDPNPQNSSFVQHIEPKTISDLREMGYDVPDDIADTSTEDPTLEATYAARAQNRDAMATLDDGRGNPATREVWFKETYARVDYDGDGVAELRRICQVGSTILANDEIEEIQFVGWTPYQQLFQFDGRCPADEAIEIQDIKSTLWRQNLDNIYTINNNRVFAGNRVNLDDLLDNQIAGVVRVDSDVVGNQVQALPITPLGPVIQPAIEYADSVKENRTGFTRYNQGMDADSLNKTATGVRLIQQAGNERVALIQRAMAEQAIKPLMLGLHRLCRSHATKAETVRLRGKWVQIDPRTWAQRYDMTVSVGLGTMDKSMELQAQQQLIGMQTGLAQAGICTPENMYNAATKFVELMGEKNADKYFTHPQKMPPPPDPTQNPEIMLKIKEAQQKDRELDQHDRELDQLDARFGLDARNAELDALERHQRLTMEVASHEREMTAPAPTDLQAEQQAHSQALDMRKQEMAERGQEHSQQMAEAALEADDGQA